MRLYGSASPGQSSIRSLLLFQGLKLLFQCLQSLFEKYIFSLSILNQEPRSSRTADKKHEGSWTYRSATSEPLPAATTGWLMG